MSEMKQLVIIGAATALLETLDLIAAINAVEPQFKVIGALDDNAALHGTEIGGTPVLGALSKAKEFKDVHFVFAISSYRIRLKRIDIFKSLGISREKFVNLIHPAA